MGCNKIETKNQKASYNVVWIAVVEGAGDVANAKFVFLHLQRMQKWFLIEQSLVEKLDDSIRRIGYGIMD